jgi:hypothetical protein
MAAEEIGATAWPANVECARGNKKDDPFYSSITPQLYAIGCATVVSYLLVIILLITPRTFRLARQRRMCAG